MNQDLLAYFISWTTYGSFLPGDERGWTKWRAGDQVPQPLLLDWCHDRLLEPSLTLSEKERKIVEEVIAEHCLIRQWTLHTVNCRTNHCHVVVSAFDYAGDEVREQFKSWATRRLKEHRARTTAATTHLRSHWWTRKGSVRHLFTEDDVAAAIVYVRDMQDFGGSKVGK